MSMVGIRVLSKVEKFLEAAAYGGKKISYYKGVRIERLADVGIWVIEDPRTKTIVENAWSWKEARDIAVKLIKEKGYKTLEVYCLRAHYIFEKQ